MKIHIVRHGQTEWNIENRMQGSKNSDLTEQGRIDALKLGSSLQDINIDYIYTSPLTRAYDTALLIKGDRDIPLQVHENLIEMSFGIWEGMLNDYVVETYKDEHYKFWNEPHLFIPQGGESFEGLIKRVRLTLDDIIKQNKGEDILIVTHTIVIKAIYSIVKGYELKDFWNPPFIKNTSLTVLEYNDGKYNFVLEADTSHADS